jgi:hypothetical protein
MLRREMEKELQAINEEGERFSRKGGRQRNWRKRTVKITKEKEYQTLLKKRGEAERDNRLGRALPDCSETH